MPKTKLVDHCKKVGSTIQHKMNGLTIDVTIEDVKLSWGQVKYSIKPVSGSGSIWIVAPEEN